MTRHRAKLRIKREQSEFARWTLRHGSRKNGSASWTFHLEFSAASNLRLESATHRNLYSGHRKNCTCGPADFRRWLAKAACPRSDYKERENETLVEIITPSRA